MAIRNVLIPQMGEGLQEVVLIGFHKKPGDSVLRDEPLYSMETDKAVMDVESPFDGIVTDWLVAEGDVLPIGACIGHIESSAVELQPAQPPAEAIVPAETSPALDAANSVSAVSPVAIRSQVDDVIVPPRSRAYCREHGISDEEMRAIPAATGKLMPSDIDAYLEQRQLISRATTASADSISGVVSQQTGQEPPDQTPGTGKAPFTECPLSRQQRVFTSRVRRSGSLVVPATMTRPLPWDPIVACVKSQRAQDFTFRPTEFQTIAWCVAQAVSHHPKFRSILPSDDAVREYDHVNLGIAVALKTGELVTGVVRNADTLDYREFVRQAQLAIALAREGKDQADADTQLHLTYMGAYEIVEAVPVLVAPAIAVLFVGAAYPREGMSYVNLSLTFDHRLINGVEGARFLKSIVDQTALLPELN